MKTVGRGSLPLAVHIADTMVSFQTPAGGWSKNQDRADPARLPGQRYGNDAETMVQDPAKFDAPYDDVVSGQPIFGDKDRTIHDDVNQISVGRRNGYNWWVTQPQE